MLTYSTRKQIGNALVKLSGVDYHFELRNDKWVQTNNSHLTNMEKVIIVNFDICALVDKTSYVTLRDSFFVY